MSPDRWRKVEELYHAARERDVTLRAVYLHEACAGDDSLRREVESLLAQDAAAESFLEASPVKDVAAQAARDAQLFGHDPAESEQAAPGVSQEQSLVGRQLGLYQVRAKIGEGGMGEVYRAFDTKLRRDVALKVLPKQFARDPERMIRFRREAQLLASLNHKNVAAIYGFEELPEANFLVLELVEGETLQERSQKPGVRSQNKTGIPIEAALGIAKQVAEGLEAAHRKGITHRDIKPANIKVTPEGVVKVLDFGLAKAFAGDRANADLSDLPTLEPGPTKDGQILGTPAYMSPEQVRGQDVDKRTDIWAFGCVLYELLTGHRVFPSRHPSRERERPGVPLRAQPQPPLAYARGSAKTALADIISSVLNDDPDWSTLPAETPATIRSLLRRCLQKESNRRLQDVGDARIEIEEALSASATTVPAVTPAVQLRKGWRAALLPVLASVAVAAVITGLVVWNLRPTPIAQPVARFSLALPSGQGLTSLGRHVVALSPDGTHLVYVANNQLHLRAIDQLESTPIRGTEGGGRGPFFSPDGQWVGFWAIDGTLKKVSINGGAPVTLCEAENPFGASWGADDTIVFGQGPDGIWQVPASGGTPQRIVTLDSAIPGSAHGPQILPGGESVLFTLSMLSGSWDDSQIVMQNLETGERRVLIEGGTDARYVPTGHLIYIHEGTLLAAPFDLGSLAVTGSPSPIVEGVMQAIGGVTGAAHFSFSRNGSFAYVPGVSLAPKELVWMDRQGALQPVGAPPRNYTRPAVSPDGKQIAVNIEGQTSDIWIYDIARSTLTRLTFEGNNGRPIWTPDGKRIVFPSDRGGSRRVFWKLADGTGPEEQITDDELGVTSISPDGKLAFAGLNQAEDLGILELQGERKVSVFLQTPFDESLPMISPDGRYVAYLSNESGRSELYVRGFPGPEGKWQISTEGAAAPVWAPNGRELFFFSGQRLMVADITPGPTFQAGTPRFLKEGPFGTRPAGLGQNYSISPDGQRLLMIQAPEQQPFTQINVVLNWFEELKRRVPSGQ